MVIESPAPQEQVLERVDKDNEKNPQYVVPYVKEIYEYLRTEEVILRSLTMVNVPPSQGTFATLAT